MGCAVRLDDAIVLLLDATGNNLSELTINNSYEGKRHELIYDDVPNVSSVKIVGRDNFVELAMVEVEGVRTLESLITDDATATQSSTYQGHYVAKNAIDKDTNKFSHTNTGDAEWWKVNLGFVETVSKVIVYNRADCCAVRLDDAKVLLLDAAGNNLSELTINNSYEGKRHELIYDDVPNVSSVKLLGGTTQMWNLLWWKFKVSVQKKRRKKRRKEEIRNKQRIEIRKKRRLERTNR